MDSHAKEMRSNVPLRLDRTYLSPTRRHNPQMLGLVYQSPLKPEGQHLAIWDHEPVFRQTISRFPNLMNHLGMVNFHSGNQANVWPSDRQRAPPVIHRSLKSTNRYSYQNPNEYTGLANVSKQLKQKSCRPPSRPAIGIVPRLIAKDGQRPIRIRAGAKTQSRQ
eukprot:TCONS_00007041-protein